MNLHRKLLERQAAGRPVTIGLIGAGKFGTMFLSQVRVSEGMHLVGVAGPAARALATWTQPAYARAELAERAPLHMPPTVRVAAVEGTAAAVAEAIAQLRADVPALTETSILGPVAREDSVRALVRFEYALGRAVAESLRASVVAAALRGRRRRGAPSGQRNTLRARLDVPDLDL